MPRPEDMGPAQIYYNAENAAQYATNTRMNDIQEQLAGRALDLLNLQETGLLLLDVGCGTGLSTRVLNENGYLTFGVDISADMLEQNETENLVQLDIGDGLPFQPGTFDGCVSISVLQWLCYSNAKQEDPFRRLFGFFTSLFACLKPGAGAVFQFYPESEKQLQLVQDAATKAGFAGRIQIDYPNSAKAKKIYLVLQCGLTAAIGSDLGRKDKNFQKKNGVRVERVTRVQRNSREWKMQKLEKQALLGEEVKAPTKYMGRKRKTMWGF